MKLNRGDIVIANLESVSKGSIQKYARRVLFIKDGEVFHQIYRGNLTSEELYAKISDTLTMLTTGGEKHE